MKVDMWKREAGDMTVEEKRRDNDELEEKWRMKRKQERKGN